MVSHVGIFACAEIGRGAAARSGVSSSDAIGGRAVVKSRDGVWLESVALDPQETLAATVSLDKTRPLIEISAVETAAEPFGSNPMIRRYAIVLCSTLAVIAALFVCMLAFPGALFAHSIGSGLIVVASDRPIPSIGGLRLAQQCEQLIARSPLRPTAQPYRVYITASEWRHRLIFAISPQAGGIAYYLFGRHAFLSGANFETGQLLKADYAIEPPRTLAYYCAHEITHIIIGEKVGLVGLLRLPKWANEGLADYVGIEARQTFEELQPALGDRPVDLAMMTRFGVYPRYRLLVTYFLETRGWSIEQLLATRLSFDEATTLMRNGGG